MQSIFLLALLLKVIILPPELTEAGVGSSVLGWLQGWSLADNIDSCLAFKCGQTPSTGDCQAAQKGRLRRVANVANCFVEYASV